MLLFIIPELSSICIVQVVIYGGFSRVREGRSERGMTHADLWRLTERAGGGWQWRALAGWGAAGAPPPRAQIAAALNTHQARAYVFGGVTVSTLLFILLVQGFPNCALRRLVAP